MSNPADQSTTDAISPPVAATASSSAPLIVCQDVRFQYPQSFFRLFVDSLEIHPGQSIALVGPSGSGKTTLLDLIGGVRQPDFGTIHVNGVSIPDLSEAARREFRLRDIGYVFQAFELFDHLTARENILFPLGASGWLKRDRQEFESEMNRLAESTGLSALLNQRTETLSRGEQQRVALCRALVHRPLLVLADEPTGNLDPSNKRMAMSLLRSIVSGHNATLIAATHDESLLGEFDRVIDVSEMGNFA